MSNNVPNSNNNGSNQRQPSGGGSGQQQTGTDKVRQQVPSKVNDVLNKK
jgi:hypothetical protein